MGDLALSPSVSQKLRNRESAHKMRHGSPKLQEVLRERCRQKMREKRSQLFNRSRTGLNNIQDTLTEIVRKELSNLATGESIETRSLIIDEPLDPEEALELENEILTEEEQWILEEYEKMSREEMEFLILDAEAAIDNVLCPMCQKGYLIQNINSITCKSCNSILNTDRNVQEVGRLVLESVNAHSINCTEVPEFALVPENNSTYLYIACQVCSTLAQII